MLNVAVSGGRAAGHEHSQTVSIFLNEGKESSVGVEGIGSFVLSYFWTLDVIHKL